MLTLRRAAPAALPVSDASRELAVVAPTSNALCAQTIVALRSSEATLSGLVHRATYRRDKIDGAAVQPAMMLGMTSVIMGGPLAGMAADSFLVGLYAALAAGRLAYGYYRRLENRVQAEERLGASAKAFDTTLALFDTSTPEGRAIAAEMASRIVRRLNDHDVRGASLRDRLHVYIDDPRVDAEARESAGRIIGVLQQLAPPVKHMTETHAATLLADFTSLTPAEQAVVGPFATQQFFNVKKLPKAVSYERFHELQSAFARRPAQLG